MRYRCPYCGHNFDERPASRCPACDKVMRVPPRSDPVRWRLKRRAISRIMREYEQKRAALGNPVPPTLFRNPKFYFAAIVVFVFLGILLSNTTDKAVRRMEVTPHMRAIRNLDVLAEALGRYHFHTGSFPDAVPGLAALVRDPAVPKWDGPYIRFLRNDPWNTPFVYAPPAGNGLPTLFSCGEDRIPHTPDDLFPDPARFDPGTAWTNGWVSAEQRLPGVTVLPSFPDGKR
jgi:type II secretion system protein G